MKQLVGQTRKPQGTDQEHMTDTTKQHRLLIQTKLTSGNTSEQEVETDNKTLKDIPTK